MGTEAELERWLRRAERTLRTTDIGSVFARYRAVVGPPAEELSQLARDALNALANGVDPAPEQLQALELAIRLHRPAPLVQHDEVGTLGPDAAQVFSNWGTFRSAVRPYLRGIGRIDRKQPTHSPRIVGTAFLVGPTAVATNRHVVDALTLGTGRLAAGQAELRFGQESGVVPDAPAVPIVAVLALHDHLDLCLLQIETEVALSVPPLVHSNDVVERGEQVAVIGYPSPDARNPYFIGLLFGALLGVKRAAPGEVTDVQAARLYHDCTTLGGNSGSPIVALADARLVGVHTDGYFLARNQGIAGPRVFDFLALGEDRR